MIDQVEYTEDCISCDKKDSLDVTCLMDLDSGDIVKFIYQECKECGWNQYS